MNLRLKNVTLPPHPPSFVIGSSHTKLSPDIVRVGVKVAGGGFAFPDWGSLEVCLDIPVIIGVSVPCGRSLLERVEEGVHLILINYVNPEHYILPSGITCSGNSQYQHTGSEN